MFCFIFHLSSIITTFVKLRYVSFIIKLLLDWIGSVQVVCKVVGLYSVLVSHAVVDPGLHSVRDKSCCIKFLRTWRLLCAALAYVDVRVRLTRVTAF